MPDERAESRNSDICSVTLSPPRSEIGNSDIGIDRDDDFSDDQFTDDDFTGDQFTDDDFTGDQFTDDDFTGDYSIGDDFQDDENSKAVEMRAKTVKLMGGSQMSL